MRGQVKFNPEVQRAVFCKQRMTNRCLEHVPATSLVDEDEMASRGSEFQLANLAGKRALHHLSRKKCRLRMRQDIIDAFWTVYEQEAWHRLNEAAENRDVTVKDAEVFALEAILSVNKNEIVKLWREKLMLMSRIVEQHEMVPFHDRWVQNQFKDEENVEEMQRRLHTKANTSNDWLTELVNEMLVSPDTPPTPEFNTERVTEALTELEFLHPEIFKDLKSVEESMPGEQTAFLNTSLSEEFETFETDDNTLIQAMEEWEEKELEDAIEIWDYSYLLDDEVSKKITLFCSVHQYKPKLFPIIWNASTILNLLDISHFEFIRYPPF